MVAYLGRAYNPAAFIKKAGASGIVGNSYPTEVLVDAPVRYFRLNDTTGLVATEYQGFGNGSYNSGCTLDQASPVVAGGKFVAFDAAASPGGKVDTNYNTNLSEFTIEFLFNANAAGHDSNSFLISKNQFFASATTSFPYAIRWDVATKKLVLILNAGSSYTPSLQLTSGALADATTYHVVVYYKANTAASIYINGFFNAYSAIAFAINSISYNWAIGSPSTELGGGINAGSFSGKIGEVAFYDHELSPSRILTHYNAIGVA